MFECHKCGIDLVTDGLPSGRLVRCVKCLGLSAVTSKDNSNRYRRAWWSLGLGAICPPLIVIAFVLLFNEWPVVSLISLMLLFLAGCPAFYLGVKCLLQMRYIKASSASKFAAITGSTLGLFCGVMFGGFCVLIGLIGVMVALTTQSANGVEDSLPMARKVVDFNFPEKASLRPYRCRRSPFNFGSIRFRNTDSYDDASLHLNIVRWPQWMSKSNPQAFFKMATREDFGKYRGAKELESTLIEDWNLPGTDQKLLRIKKVLMDEESDNRKHELMNYCWTFNSKYYSILAMLVHEPTESGLTEDDIRAIVESTGRSSEPDDTGSE